MAACLREFADLLTAGVELFRLKRPMLVRNRENAGLFFQTAMRSLPHYIGRFRVGEVHDITG